jgi:hypothetical protein
MSTSFDSDSVNVGRSGAASVEIPEQSAVGLNDVRDELAERHLRRGWVKAVLVRRHPLRGGHERFRIARQHLANAVAHRIRRRFEGLGRE